MENFDDGMTRVAPDGEFRTVKKKVKHYRCSDCGKEYCFLKCALKHSKKKKHTKFKEINRDFRGHE